MRVLLTVRDDEGDVVGNGLGGDVLGQVDGQQDLELLGLRGLRSGRALEQQAGVVPRILRELAGVQPGDCASVSRDKGE